MVSGNSVYKQIKGKISEVETQSENLATQLYKVEQHISDLTNERENCYDFLAVHYLPELDAQTVQTTLREVREDVEGVFKKKQTRRSSLERLMKENRGENHKSEKEIDQYTLQIELEAKERDKTLKLIEGDLQKDRNYQQKDEEAKKSEARLQGYKKRVEEIQGEASKKLPAFENNKIFSYLLKNSYGTTQYNRGDLIKRLDSWVAEKVNFRKNKECYDFLKSMPEMMKQEVAGRQEELDEVVFEMEEIESTVEKQYRLPEIVARARKLMSQRQTLMEKDKKEDEQYLFYVKKREDMDNKKGSYHAHAVQKIKSFLDGEQIGDLKSRARQTRGTEDDKIVDRIDYIDNEMQKLKDKAKDVRFERDTISKRLGEFRKIEKRFRSKNYNGSYSSFSSGFDINTLLIGYMIGKITSDDINRQIDSSQHTKTPSYHSSSSYSGSHSSSSGFGGFSSGGGFGGGGFSSGGGF